ncbi:NAD(P)H-binding protein [Streptomyces viridiviolaceus]
MTPIAGDLIEDFIDELAEKIARHDAVECSAGAHGTGRDLTTLIDGKGVEKAATATTRVGAFRFILVSTLADLERASGLVEGAEHYIKVEWDAEVYLTRTDLDQIRIRPGHLLDGAGDGLIAAGLALRESDIRRENLARFIEALHNQHSSTLSDPRLSVSQESRPSGGEAVRRPRSWARSGTADYSGRAKTGGTDRPARNGPGSVRTAQAWGRFEGDC